MPNFNNKSVILLSGGLDSTVLLHYITKIYQKNTIAILINYNQRHDRELACATQNALNINCNIININADFIGNITKSTSVLTNLDKEVPHIKDVVGLAQPPTYVPMRNLMFLSIAAAVAESNGADTVYYGAAEVDTHSGHWDCTLDFLNYINKLLNLNRQNKIQVEAPFITYSKEQIIRLGSSLDVDFTLTHTCYRGDSIACGTCASCSSRIQGFLAAGIKDPIKYAIDIPWN